MCITVSLSFSKDKKKGLQQFGMKKNKKRKYLRLNSETV